MNLHSLLWSLLATLLSPGLTTSTTVTIQSGPARINLLELYTSEGCSSCPPAEEWFSTLRQSPRLWKEIVPISFHINYWDDLGWKDSLATQAFTDRQRNYAAAWHAESVYTPEFILNGEDWRGRDLNSIPPANLEPGKLSATLQANGDLQVTFAPSGNAGGPWEAHAALVGFGVTSNVAAGENSGRKLVHDFVALALQSSEMKGDVPRAEMHLPGDKINPGHSALVVWISQPGKLDPVQAAGGNL